MRKLSQHIEGGERARPSERILCQNAGNTEEDPREKAERRPGVTRRSCSYVSLAELARAEDKSEQARENATKALEIREKILEQEPNNLIELRNLGDAYTKLGVQAKAEGKRKQAREYFEKDLEIRAKIVAEWPLMRITLNNLSDSFKRLGNLLKAEGEREQAEEYHTKAQDLQKRIVELTRDDLP